MGRFDFNKIIVLKIGTSSLVDENKQIDQCIIENLADQICQINEYGKNVIIVTSGAIAVGANRLGVRPNTISLKQACAAVGQARLIDTYEAIFEKKGIKVAQILVNHDDFDNRKRMLNLRNTLEELINRGVVPIINENDALAVNEIRVGDNDTLAALISATCKADLLVLLSDIDGLYDKNPKTNEAAKLIAVVEKITDDVEAMASGTTSDVGTGGMSTKIRAAKIATSAGIDMLIMNAKQMNEVSDLFREKRLGTLFKRNVKLPSRSHWMVYTTNPKGVIIVDAGACKALFERRSLLAKGVKDVMGFFSNNSVVEIVNEKMEEIAKGIVNYSSDEIKAIKGKNSQDFISIIGHKEKDEIIHANDLVIIGGEDNA